MLLRKIRCLVRSLLCALKRCASPPPHSLNGAHRGAAGKVWASKDQATDGPSSPSLRPPQGVPGSRFSLCSAHSTSGIWSGTWKGESKGAHCVFSLEKSNHIISLYPNHSESELNHTQERNGLDAVSVGWVEDGNHIVAIQRKSRCMGSIWVW